MSEEACAKRFYRWGIPKPDRRATRVKGWDSSAVQQADRTACIGWGEMVRSGYKAKQHPNALPTPTRPRRSATAVLEDEFVELAEAWQRDTRYYSITSKKIAHPAYLRIIGMGMPVLPLVLQSLQEKPAHWFSALHAITNSDPAINASNPSEARDAWLAWGREHHYIT
jgi:hypothetical protein